MFRSWFSSNDSQSSGEMPRSPHFKAPSDMTDTQSKNGTIRKGFYVTGQINVTCEARKLTDAQLKQILFDWATSYSGPFLLEGMVKCIVLIGFANFHQVDWMDGGKYGATVDLDTTFGFSKSDLIPQKYLHYNVSLRKRLGGDSYMLSIHLEFSPGIDSSKPIEGVYKSNKGPGHYGKGLKSILGDIFQRFRKGDGEEVILN
ncbi:MAG: matrix protein [Wufeng bat tupavirus 2]|nr:MAG: matrix protein [Wufeng bat tupavirus 2]